MFGRFDDDVVVEQGMYVDLIQPAMTREDNSRDAAMERMMRKIKARRAMSVQRETLRSS